MDSALGVNEDKLRNFMGLKVTETIINEFGQYNELESTVSKEIAKSYFEAIVKVSIPVLKPTRNNKIYNLIHNPYIEGFSHGLIFHNKPENSVQVSLMNYNNEERERFC